MRAHERGDGRSMGRSGKSAAKRRRLRETSLADKAKFAALQRDAALHGRRRPTARRPCPGASDAEIGHGATEVEQATQADGGDGVFFFDTVGDTAKQARPAAGRGSSEEGRRGGAKASQGKNGGRGGAAGFAKAAKRSQRALPVVDSDVSGESDDSEAAQARRDYAAECSSDDGYGFTGPGQSAAEFQDQRGCRADEELLEELEAIRAGILRHSVHLAGDSTLRREHAAHKKRSDKARRRAQRQGSLGSFAAQMRGLVAAADPAAPVELLLCDAPHTTRELMLLKVLRLAEAFSLGVVVDDATSTAAAAGAAGQAAPRAVPQTPADSAP